MTNKVEREAKLEQELEALLEELARVDKELSLNENGFASSLLSLFLAILGIVCTSNLNTFSVLLVGVIYYLFARCGNRWSQLYNYRETVKAQVIELRKQMDTLDQCD
jgi:hypothetical protein